MMKIMRFRIEKRSIFMMLQTFFVMLALLLCGGCLDISTPNPFNKVEEKDHPFDYDDILNNGELIILTLYGPDTYFEFHGEGYGHQFKIAEDFARQMGVCVRVELSYNVDELISKFISGNGDMIAYNLPVTDSLDSDILYCGEKQITHLIDSLSSKKSVDTLSVSNQMAWAVRTNAPVLAEHLNEYFADNESRFYEMLRPKVRKIQAYRKGKRYSYVSRISPKKTVMDASKGIISPYDNLYRENAPRCGWDWRLLAAQSYRESGFDPNAVSSAGASGLMQLMPSTGAHYGVTRDLLFVPSANIAGAAKCISKLNSYYSSITNPDERINFVLAAYNAGKGHIDDARRLAKKFGRNPDVWAGNVDEMVLALMDSQYNHDPVVKYGYMRGTETYRYVTSVRELWNYYKTVAK